MGNFDFVILAAARAGGIKANIDNKSQFIHKNLMIALNVSIFHTNEATLMMYLSSLDILCPVSYRWIYGLEDVLVLYFENDSCADRKVPT